MAYPWHGSGRPAVPAELRRQLAESHGDAYAEEVRRSVRVAVRTAQASGTAVVFGGHFSSGKSTLLNALLGGDLLPTDDFPETGVPCRIVSGARERAVAATAAGTVELAFGREALSGVVSLVGADGEYREDVHGVHEVRLTVTGGGPAGRGCCWIDSPGIDDTADVHDRAARTAAAGDALVWVVDSRRPLSVGETEFLREHRERTGTGAALFVVNAFLSEDTTAGWQRFLSRADYFRERIAALGDAETEVVFVSARAASGGPDFGLGDVRDRLDALGLRTHPSVRTVRLHRAAQALARLADDAAARRDRLDREMKEAARRRSELERAEAAARAECMRNKTARLIADGFARLGHEVRACGSAVAAEMGDSGDLSRDGRYAASLSRRVEQVCDALADELMAAVTEVAREQLHRPPGADVRAAVGRRLHPGELTLNVPDTPLGKARGGAGGALGAAIGTMVLPGIGTLIGALAGSFTGAVSAADAALSRDREGAKADALRAAEDAAQVLDTRKPTVTRLFTKACTPLPVLEPATDPAPLAVLDRLHDHLWAQAERLTAAGAQACVPRCGRTAPAEDGR
ncbi:dynamin family protein [Streptomyces sp. NPDC056738]|uniref:dynamin family protein n=1 Tax=Streptomyces sp. NPDC056738 TaxID=3345933 RepID=UPI0036CAC3C2